MANPPPTIKPLKGKGNNTVRTVIVLSLLLYCLCVCVPLFEQKNRSHCMWMEKNFIPPTLARGCERFTAWAQKILAGHIIFYNSQSIRNGHNGNSIRKSSIHNYLYVSALFSAWNRTYTCSAAANIIGIVLHTWAGPTACNAFRMGSSECVCARASAAV